MTTDRARGDERLPPTGSVKVVGPRKAARLESHQRADGSVVSREVLRPYLGGLEGAEPVA